MRISKMSKLWYEARDAIKSGKYLTTRTCILREYLAELSIVQPWESDEKAFDAVCKKNDMINKLKKEIERRNRKQLALIRKTLYSIAVGISVYILGRVIYDKIFPESPKVQKEQTQPLLPIQNQSTSNQQKPTAKQPPTK